MGTTYVMRPQRYGNNFYSRGPITDDSGMQRFEVQDRGALSRKLSIRDAAGTEVAVSSRGALSGWKLFAGDQRFTVRYHGFPHGVNWRDIEINSAADRMETVGDYRHGRPFSITREGTAAAAVRLGKQYAVEVADGEDHVLMLAVALTIACMLDDHRAAQSAYAEL